MVKITAAIFTYGKNVAAGSDHLTVLFDREKIHA